jgi:sec-independent protein translocase protein TatC
VSAIRQKRPSQFERASDGSMTLFEHLKELRGRLFKASLGIAIGTAVGLYFALDMFNFLTAPYCQIQEHAGHTTSCLMSAGGGPLDPFLIKLKVGLYLGLLASAPVWLYQLWAFIAPGLHKRERRYTYMFTAIAVPLFAAGVVLAHLIVTKTLHLFLTLPGYTVISDINGYYDFVTNMMLLFGIAFEFPLLIVMLNLVGMVSGRRLLAWWRPAVFLMFLFGAIVTPTPDPFSMSILAGCMALLYFAAVGFALLNDKRKGRNRPYADLDDDEVSSLDAADLDEVTAGDRVSVPEPVAPPRPLDRDYDDFT